MIKSYSWRAKEDLAHVENVSSCCDYAQLAGMLLLSGKVTYEKIRFVTENQSVAKCFTQLVNQCFSAECIQQKENTYYTAEITDKHCIEQIIQQFGLRDAETRLLQYRISSRLFSASCCRSALLRGVFLGGGTVIDPQKNYNLEIITPYYRLSQELFSFLNACGFSCKIVTRKSKYVIYIKNSDIIGDVLAFIGAHRAQMELLNIKIEKEVRNDLNRTVNSETANLEKTISASVVQIHAIEKIQQEYGLDNLEDDLKETALVRLENRNLSLGELGKLFHPPLTKSGVNHRLRRLVKFAEEL